MRSVNKVILVGNLTRDPETRTTDNGQIVATFGLATNRDWTTKEGERKSSAEYHECVAWARLGEICGQYLKKGKLVYVEGYLKTRSWDTPEGVKKFKTEIIVQDMIMLEKRGAEDHEEAAPTQSKPREEQQPKPATAATEKAATEKDEPTPELEDGEESIVDKDLGL